MESEVILVGRPDVALLAKVRRPVVSIWAGRGARSGTPFPAPALDTGRQELFDGAQVVDWLEATGRGNNPDARADLAAFGVLADAPLDDPAVFAGVTALLCLQVVAGELPTDRADLLDLADESDPDDEYLFTEIEELGDRLDPLARYTRLLATAAYHPAKAFERLMVTRSRTPGHTQTALAAPARRLVAAVALALGVDVPAPIHVDPCPGTGDLLVELAAAREALTAAIPPATGAAARLALRRLRVHDVVRQPLRVHEHGVELPAGAIVIMQLTAMPDREVLTTIDDVVLGTDRNVRAVVVGPASALTDGLRGDRAAVAARDDILRTDRVRGIVRLPAGLLPGEPRRRLGLWCLGPVPGGADEPRTVVADLTDVALGAAVIDDLVTDLVAGVRGGRALVAHSLRFGRAAPTRAVRARSGDLVEPATQPARTTSTAELLTRIAVLEARLPVLPAVRVPVTATGGDPPEPATTLGAAAERGELRVLPGLRLRPEHVDPVGNVRLLGPDELAGARPGRRVDRLVLAAHYPTHAFTEPGDVVFCTSPPRAVVDRAGGAVATFPAQVLRCRDARLVPEALAVDINAQPMSARTWRAWSVRRVPAHRARALAAMLGGLARHRDELADRLDALTGLATALVDGVAAAGLDLEIFR